MSAKEYVTNQGTIIVNCLLGLIMKSEKEQVDVGFLCRGYLPLSRNFDALVTTLTERGLSHTASRERRIIELEVNERQVRFFFVNGLDLEALYSYRFDALVSAIPRDTDGFYFERLVNYAELGTIFVDDILRILPQEVEI